MGVRKPQCCLVPSKPASPPASSYSFSHPSHLQSVPTLPCVPAGWEDTCVLCGLGGELAQVKHSCVFGGLGRNAVSNSSTSLHFPLKHNASGSACSLPSLRGICLCLSTCWRRDTSARMSPLRSGYRVCKASR